MIAHRLKEQQELLDGLDEIPGVNQRVAQVIAAEVGTDVKRFPTAECLISWAGICPGNNQSGGKRRNGHIKPGNRSLRVAIVEAANAAGKKKNCYLSILYRRLAARRGEKRALIAVARTILQICYYMIARGTRYQDLGADYFDRRNPERLAKRLAKRIETPGLQRSPSIHPRSSLNPTNDASRSSTLDPSRPRFSREETELTERRGRRVV